MVLIIEPLLDRTDLQSQDWRELSTPEEGAYREPEAGYTSRSPPLRKNQQLGKLVSEKAMR